MSSKIQDCQGKSSIYQEENSFHQPNGLKLKEETSKVQHLEHSFVSCWNLAPSDGRSEISENFWKVVLENDEKHQMDQTRQKL